MDTWKAATEAATARLLREMAVVSVEGTKQIMEVSVEFAGKIAALGFHPDGAHMNHLVVVVASAVEMMNQRTGLSLDDSVDAYMAAVAHGVRQVLAIRQTRKG